MKIVFLNTWGGKEKSLKDFILDQSTDTDIFCFQESVKVKSKVFCESWLPNYQLFFDKKFINKFDQFNQATFVKKGLEVIETKTLGENNPNVGLGLFTKIKTPKGVISLCNVHGFARPGDKQDTPGRLEQSQIFIDFLKSQNGLKIIGGDFNLDFNTKSVQMFEDNGFKNLIKDFNIKSTRNELSWKKFKTKQFFADFLFTSPDLKISNFSVPYNEVSDHLPMLLEFNL